MAKYSIVHSVRVCTEFTPETYGRLTTIGPVFLLDGDKCSMRQAAQCECGNTFIVRRTAKAIRLPPCANCKTKINRSIHGKSGTDEHNIWLGLLARCYNKNVAAYSKYGASGVGVFPAWRTPDGSGFLQFMAYIGPRPSKQHSVDRFPNKEGNYEPGNVRWATRKEQANNTKSNYTITHNDRTQNLAQWAEETGISAECISRRLKRGWTTKEALTIPPGTKRSKNATT